VPTKTFLAPAWPVVRALLDTHHQLPIFCFFTVHFVETKYNGASNKQNSSTVQCYRYLCHHKITNFIHTSDGAVVAFARLSLCHRLSRGISSSTGWTAVIKQNRIIYDFTLVWNTYVCNMYFHASNHVTGRQRFQYHKLWQHERCSGGRGSAGRRHGKRSR
jgi:hypothetical protein